VAPERTHCENDPEDDEQEGTRAIQSFDAARARPASQARDDRGECEPPPHRADEHPRNEQQRARACRSPIDRAHGSEDGDEGENRHGIREREQEARPGRMEQRWTLVARELGKGSNPKRAEPHPHQERTPGDAKPRLVGNQEARHEREAEGRNGAVAGIGDGCAETRRDPRAAPVRERPAQREQVHRADGRREGDARQDTAPELCELADRAPLGHESFVATETYPPRTARYHDVSMSLPRRNPAHWLGVALLLALARPDLPAAAESSLRLPLPAVMGTIPSATYDDTGKRLGEARIDSMKLPNGNTYLLASGGIDHGEAMVLSTELAPVDGGKALAPLWQMSHSYDKQGRSLGIMFIDHEKKRAFCSHEDGRSEPPDELEVPQPDRVAHVPLNLLFLPLAKGETEKIEFQFLLCALGPRFVDARATVARELPAREGAPALVEVRYELDLNPVLEAIARPFLPRFSFWFNPGSRDSYVAHRMPLGSKSPAVLIVRTGIAPRALDPEP
jgi:hypothetical protein